MTSKGGPDGANIVKHEDDGSKKKTIKTTHTQTYPILQHPTVILHSHPSLTNSGEKMRIYNLVLVDVLKDQAVPMVVGR